MFNKKDKEEAAIEPVPYQNTEVDPNVLLDDTLSEEEMFALRQEICYSQSTNYPPLKRAHDLVIDEIIDERNRRRKNR